MNQIIHKIIMMCVFLTGFICFICYSFNQDFFLSTAIFSLSILIINLHALLTNTLSHKNIFNLFSLFMFFIAMSVFGNYGVEQKPIGYQTLYSFNLEGIAVSIVFFLFSSLLFMMGTKQNINNQVLAKPTISKTITKPISQKNKKKSSKNNKVIQSNDWEEASLEDLESGKYQVL